MQDLLYRRTGPPASLGPNPQELPAVHPAGVGDLDSALGYKGKVVSIRRSDVRLPDGEYFTAELLGLTVLDAETKEELGKIADVIPYPGHDVYVVQGKKSLWCRRYRPLSVRSTWTRAPWRSMCGRG